jgi:hypothetical protein
MPQLSQKPQQTRVRVLAALVTALVLDDALADPWRDDERRHADAQTRVKSNVMFLPVGGFPGISETVADRDVLGRRDVVSEAAVLVEGEDEEGRVPLRGGAESLADALDEGFAERDGAGRVEGEVGAAFRVDIGELREGTGQCRIARGV